MAVSRPRASYSYRVTCPARSVELIRRPNTSYSIAVEVPSAKSMPDQLAAIVVEELGPAAQGIDRGSLVAQRVVLGVRRVALGVGYRSWTAAGVVGRRGDQRTWPGGRGHRRGFGQLIAVGVVGEVVSLPSASTWRIRLGL